MLPRVPSPDRVKIGITTDVQKRRRSLEHACGSLLTILFALETESVEVARSHERHIHERLTESRMRGEWFECNDHVLAIMYFMKRMGFDGFASEHVEFRPDIDGDKFLDDTIAQTLKDNEAANAEIN
jgi:hypothetical protein